MEIKRLSQCCCCCSLRTGTLIIALLGIINDLIGIGVAAYYVDLTNYYGRNGHPELHIIKIVCIIAIVVVLFSLAINSSLAYGVMADRPGFMMPFIILTTIGIVLASIGVLIQAILQFAGAAVGMGFLQLIGGSLGVLLQCYLWLVVYSHYRDLRDAEGEGRNATKA